MSKLKSLFPQIFGTGKQTTDNHTTMLQVEGRLETDALPVDENGQDDGDTVSNTPTASAELTESVVRELSDPNYNSMDVAQATTVPGGVMSNIGDNRNNNQTMNTMNVHSAQQQVVMNFSNANNLHFGSVYNFNQSLSANSCGKGSSTTDESALAMSPECSAGSNKRQVPRKTISIVTMMQSQEEPDTRILDAVATHLGEGWKQVMRELGHSEGQIEQAIIDHQMHGNIKEVIYQLLLQWIRSADDGVATVGRLTTLLWEMQHRDCVQRMKLVWKAIVKRKTSS